MTSWRLGIVIMMLSCGLSQLFGYQSLYDNLLVPRGFGPKKGHTEFGVYGDQVHRNSKNYQQTAAFLNVALTDNFRYGLEVDSDSRVYHNVHATVFRSKIPEREEHNFALGFKNAAWEQVEDLVPNHSVLGMFGIYTISFNDRDFNFHMGAAGDQFETGALNALVGMDKTVPFGRASLEWDGADVNIGFKGPILNNLNGFVMYTPTGKSERGKIDRFLRFGLTFTDSFLVESAQPVAVSPEPEEEEQVFEDEFFEESEEELAGEILVEELEDDEFEDEDFFVEEDDEFVEEDYDEEDPEQPVLESPSLKSKALTRAAMTHMQQGLEAYYNGDLLEAAHQYHMVVSLLPNLSVGHMRLGSIYYRQGAIDKARVYWERALEIDPENEDIMSALEALNTGVSPFE